MNGLQFISVNQPVTPNPRFWPLFSLKNALFASKRPFFDQENAAFSRASPTAFSRLCPQAAASNAQHKRGCAVPAMDLSIHPSSPGDPILLN
jgi:hypothetical protein